jgi:integrase
LLSIHFRELLPGLWVNLWVGFLGGGNMGKLNSLSVARAKEPGLTADGNGLYLQITKSGSKSWLFRFMLAGKSRAMGLGAVEIVPLAEARMKIHDCRKMLMDGKDPIEVRKTARAQAITESSKAITFDECSVKYIESQRDSWKNAKHAQQWTNTLATYASPVIGHLSISAVDTSLIMQILEPIWAKKAETASRVRSRIELVLAWATVRGYRTGENPAIWRNHLDKLLPKRSRIQKVKHHSALPFEEIASFVSNLKKHGGVAARALEFLVLTATRTSETLNAEWSEIRFDEQLWVIPGERMKGGVEHRVPLSVRAIEILEMMRERSEGPYIFPGARRGRPLSNVALLKVLERMKVKVVTHGFRSTFRDWSSERTNFPREVCEQALAHSLRDKVESAYRRGDLLLKRTSLMNEWARYCMTPPKETAIVRSLNAREAN